MNNLNAERQYMTADEMIDKIGQLYEEQKEIAQAIEFGYATEDMRVRLRYSIAEMRDIACSAVKVIESIRADSAGTQQACIQVPVDNIAPGKVHYNC